MTWTFVDYERVKKNEIEIGYKMEQLGKKYKHIGIFPKTYMEKDENHERYACDIYGDNWGKNSITVSYHMADKDMLKEVYQKYDLIVIVEIACGCPKNEVKFNLTTTLEFGLDVFKPVFHIKHCIQSDVYDSSSEDFAIMINPLPEMEKRLNFTREDREQLRKAYVEFVNS